MSDGATLSRFSASRIPPVRFGTRCDPVPPADGVAGMSNLRFFLTAYAGGFAFFLAILW